MSMWKQKAWMEICCKIQRLDLELHRKCDTVSVAQWRRLNVYVETNDVDGNLF